MQHAIPTEQIGPLGKPMANAVESCVHCGFCLPACPTYHVLGEEMDSPRGRIFLMKEVLESQVDLEESIPYIDRCLGCVGCETACPSGVQYGDLITAFRAWSEVRRRRTWLDRLLRRFILETLPYPSRFRWASRLGRLAKPFRMIFPGRLRDMLDLLPTRLLKASPLPTTFPAEGQRRARVALLAGCAQQVLAPDINWATLRVLARNGVEVVIPPGQVCCGALAAHTGAAWQARKFAERNLQEFPEDVDAILTNAAGCGSGMHEYALWLRGHPKQEMAEDFSRRVFDVSQFLIDLEIVPPPALDNPLRVAYHDACHLGHAQRVKQEPRELLTAVENLEVIEIPNATICCGSAGTYNMEQPATAHQLGQQKAEAIAATQAELVATGNIGCLMQIENHLRQRELQLPVLHTMQVLDRCYHHQPLT